MVTIKSYKNYNIPKSNKTVVFSCSTGHIYSQLQISALINLWGKRRKWHVSSPGLSNEVSAWCSINTGHHPCTTNHICAKKKTLAGTIDAIQIALFKGYTLQPLPALSSWSDEQGCTWWLMLRCSLKPVARFKMCARAALLPGWALAGSNVPDTPNTLKSTLSRNCISNGPRTGTVP